MLSTKIDLEPSAIGDNVTAADLIDTVFDTAVAAPTLQLRLPVTDPQAADVTAIRVWLGAEAGLDSQDAYDRIHCTIEDCCIMVTISALKASESDGTEQSDAYADGYGDGDGNDGCSDRIVEVGMIVIVMVMVAQWRQR